MKFSCQFATSDGFNINIHLTFDPKETKNK